MNISLGHVNSIKMFIVIEIEINQEMSTRLLYDHVKVGGGNAYLYLIYLQLTNIKME